MATESFAAGALRVTYPETFGAPTELAEPGLRPRSAGPDDDTTAAIVEALGDQQFTVVGSLELAAAPTPGVRSSAAGAGAWTVDLDVAPDESAVVLLDHDGLLSWEPPRADGQPPGTRTRAAATTLTFDLTVGQQDSAPQSRGLFDAVGRVRAYVLKFVARAVAGHAMAYLERDVQRGLVVISSTDPGQWRLVTNLAEVTLPAHRAASILLLVHGTFSSTVGSFAGLAATPEGQAFLQRSIRDYDAVIGFDHPTLSIDPMENAIDLLDRLRAAQLAAPPTLDILCYSRGGLVVRSLVEYLLPSAPTSATTGTIVFVGVTNAGTSLTEPQHWDRFIDLYTNLAAASARAIGLISGSMPVAELIRGAINGVGALVKYLIAYGVDDGGVPGLAAMNPHGDFITRMNETQPHQPDPGTPWYVVSSDFRPQLLGDDDTLRELPPRLLMKLVDGLADSVFANAPNDLVVDTASMSAVDAKVGGFIADQLALGANARVYHLAYFIQPEVVAALVDWLRGQRVVDEVPRGTMLAWELPRTARQDLLVFDAHQSIAELQAQMAVQSALWAGDTHWVAVRDTGGVFDFGIDYQGAAGSYVTFPYSPDQWRFDTSAAPMMIGDPATQTVAEAINLHAPDVHVARTMEIGGATGVRVRGIIEGQPTGTVILDNGAPIAVVRQPEPPMSLDALIEDGRTPLPLPIDPPPGADDELPPGPPVPPKVEAHCIAWMPDKVQVKQQVGVTCKLSRDAIEAPPGWQGGHGEVDETQQVVVQLMGTVNAEVIGTGLFADYLPPAGTSKSIFFDFTPTDIGACEVMVIVRQGSEQLFSLTLRATVEKKLAQPGRQQSAEASAPLGWFSNMARPQTLEITEITRSGTVKYSYYMADEDLNLQFTGESPADLGDRERYVNSIYRKIENAWTANATEVETFHYELQDLGVGLFEELFPPELRKKLWTHREALTHLVVRSSEPFIPWELVHLKDPDSPAAPEEPMFLGQLGLVRWLTVQGETDGAGLWARSLRKRKDRVHSLCATYNDPATPKLPQLEDERTFLADKLGAVPVTPTFAALRTLLTNGDFDIFHFAGHGLSKDSSYEEAVIQIGDSEVKKDDFHDITMSALSVGKTAVLKRDDQGGPLVFLNACQVGRAGLQLGSLGGFAQAFIKRGAGAFISTLWSVGDAPALVFGKTFYEELLTGQKDVSDAVRSARKAARDAGDVSWLAYVVYANPAARMDLSVT